MRNGREFGSVGRATLALILIVALWALFSDGSQIAQAQDRRATEIVFIIDESGSMSGDLDAFRTHLPDIGAQLDGRIDYRLGLVGFGAADGHYGTTFPGQPHIHLPLTPSIQQFTTALNEMDTFGRVEPGFSAITLGMSDAMGFRLGARVCTIFITDENADVYVQAPDTKADALAALNDRKAIFLSVVGLDELVSPSLEATDNSYGLGPGSLSEATGGAVFGIVDFRSNPGRVLSSIIDICIKAATGEQESSTIAQPPAGADDLTKLVVANLAQLGEQVEDNHGQLGDLQNQAASWTQEIRSLQSTLADLSQEKGLASKLAVSLESIQKDVQDDVARLGVLEQNFEPLTQVLIGNQQQISQIQTQITTLDSSTTSLRVTLADLQDVQGNFRTALDEVTTQLDALSAQLKALPIDDLDARTQALEQAIASLQTGQSQLQNLMSERTTALGQDLTSLQTSVAQLTTEVKSLNVLPQEVLQLKASLSALSTKISLDLQDLGQRVEAHDKAFSDLQDKVQRSLATNKEFGQEMDSLTGRVETVEEMLSQQQNAIKELDAKSAADNQTVSTQVQGLESEISAIRDQQTAEKVKQLREQISQQQDQWAELAAHQQGTAAQVDQLQQRLQELEGLQAQITQLRQSLEGDAQGIQDNSRLSKENNARLDTVLTALSDLQHKADGQAAQWASDLAALQVMIDNNKSVTNTLQEVISGLQEEVKSLSAASQADEVQALTIEYEKTKKLAEAALAVSFSLVALGVLWLFLANAGGG